jgi:citrate lyase beta subunit
VIAAALPVWRSLAFVPATSKRFVDCASRRGADAIILDLEDSVAPSEKARAQELDGRMIGAPVVERARHLVEREAAIAAREAGMPAAAPPP